MKSDARILLNNKKWRKRSGNYEPEIWKSRGTVDARKILNSKRKQKSKPAGPVLGSYMRTKTATSFIASQIRKEISAITKVPDKRVQLSSDGNIIVTSKSKNTSQTVGRKQGFPKMSLGHSSGSRSLQQERMQFEPSSSDMDDLEHTAVNDLLDFESLPPAYVAANSLPNANLSRKSVVNQVLDKRHTMVADQLSQYIGAQNAKVQVTNLHPSVSREDVMELFGDVGIIRDIEMVRPGTALIDFYDENDAVKACDIYHNRLLDGLPMKCYLKNGTQQNRSMISQRLGERFTPLMSTTQQIASSPPVSTNTRSRYNPRLDERFMPLMNTTQQIASSSSVSTNPRSRYNPRNVQFTVKLT